MDRTVEICIEEALSDEEKKGAVGAIDFWIERKHIAEDIIVIAADNYFEVDLTDLLSQFNGKNPVVAVYDVGDKEKACEIGKACQLGLAILRKNRIIKLDEKPETPTSSIIATGIYVLPARVFPLLHLYCLEKKRDNLGSFISFLLEKERVQAYTFTRTWVDIGDEIKKGNVVV
ncbi:MAG: sugar phosphate nucleotidyltransferase [Dehalococcoidales bacterium]|nr:sugar phosphate nucleotidyltransferase [Dehalococcoidales bacterium]